MRGLYEENRTYATFFITCRAGVVVDDIDTGKTHRVSTLERTHLHIRDPSRSRGGGHAFLCGTSSKNFNPRPEDPRAFQWENTIRDERPAAN